MSPLMSKLGTSSSRSLRVLRLSSLSNGEPNIFQRYLQLVEAAEFIERSLQEAGHETRRQEIIVDQQTVWNIDVECTGRRHPEEIVVVGAHYDTVPGSPGANDNGSAVVANLALARAFCRISPERTVLAFPLQTDPVFMRESHPGEARKGFFEDEEDTAHDRSNY